VFVKLSTRSPKDAADKLKEKTLSALHEELKHVDLQDSNAVLIGVRRAFFKVARVQSGKEAMDLMMVSARTISDLKRAIEIMPPEQWNLQLVVREFVDIHPSMEFRGFVYHKKLNGLSQYFTDCYFPSLSKESDHIKERVTKYFAEVKDKINYDNYIIDFVILEKEIKIIELNPYGENTGSGLFQWAKDQSTLQDGPFEIRVVSEPHSKAKTDALIMGWKHLIEQAMKKEEKQCIIS